MKNRIDPVLPVGCIRVNDQRKARLHRLLSGDAAKNAAGPGIDIDNDNLSAIHEFQTIAQLLRVKLRSTQIGHVPIRWARPAAGNPLDEREALPSCSRFAQMILITVRAGLRRRCDGQGNGKRKQFWQRSGQQGHAKRISGRALNKR